MILNAIPTATAPAQFGVQQAPHTKGEKERESERRATRPSSFTPSQASPTLSGYVLSPHQIQSGNQDRQP